MKLITKEIENKLPELYSQDGKDPKDVKIIAKFFHCMSEWTWYIYEGHKEDNGDFTFFGLVRGFENELGYFTLAELQEIRVHGLPIERDMYFGEHTLAEAQEKRI
jgi:hypothetical protein